MIFDLSHKFVCNTDNQILSDLISSISEHGHYILVSYTDLETIMEDALEQYASATQKGCVADATCWDFDKHLQSVLETIDAASYSIDQLKVLASADPILVLENEYEMDVYRQIIDEYSHNAIGGIKSTAKILKDRINIDSCIPAGGYAGVRPILTRHNAGRYSGLLNKKSVTIIDRDTDSFEKIPERKDVFQFLQESDASISNNDIYTLDQPLYRWHMWAKREIENYLTNECFSAENCDTTALPTEHAYHKISDHPAIEEKDLKSSLFVFVQGYKKANLANIAKRMTYQDWEASAPRFNVNGKDISEIELLLLKIAKIV